MTPEEQAEFNQLTGQAPAPAGGMTAEEKAEFDMLREYSAGEMAGDVGKAAAKGVNKAGEFLADTLALPLTSTMRQLEGYKQAFTGEGGNVFSRFWEGATSDEATEIGGKKVGDFTQETFNPRPDQADYVEEMTIPEGRYPLLDAAKTATEYGVEGLVTAPLGGAKYLASGVKTAGTMAAGAAGGEAVGMGKEVGAVLGALSGDPQAVKDILKSVWSLGKKTKGKVGQYIRKADSADTATDTQLQAGLREYVRNVYPDDPAKFQETYDALLPRIKQAVADGELGTTGQLTDNAGVLQLERDFAKANRDPRVGDMNARIESQTRAPMDAVAPTGQVADAAIPIRSEIAERVQTAGDETRGLSRTLAADDAAQASAAQSAQDAAVAPFPDTLPSTAETGAGLYKTQEAAKKASLDAVKQEFKRMGGTSIPAKSVQQSVKVNFLDTLDPSDQNIFNDAFSDSMKMINTRLTGEVSVDTLSNVISQINSEANMIAKGSKSGPTLMQVDDFKEAVYQAIDIAGGDPIKRKLAGDMYRKHMARYGGGSAVGKQLKKDPEQFNAILKQGDEGLPVFKQMVEGDRAGRAAAEKSLRSLFKQAVTDQTTGELAGGAAGFLKKYKQQLDMFPKLRDEIKATATASDRLAASVAASKATGKEIKAVETAGAKKIKELETSPAAVFSDIDDAAPQVLAEVRKVMKSKKPTERIQNLTDMVKDYTPQAKEDLRRAFMEDFVNSVSATKGKKAGQLTQDGLKEFKRNRQAYEKSGLFSTKELDNIEQGMAEGQKMFMHDNAERLAKLPPVKRRIAEGMAAVGGAKIGAATTGSPLIGAAMGRKAAVSWLDSVSTAQAKKIAYELSVNPEKFVEVVERLADANLTAAQQAKAWAEVTEIAMKATVTNVIEDYE